jgi:hypothetical protein
MYSLLKLKHVQAKQNHKKYTDGHGAVQARTGKVLQL